MLCFQRSAPRIYTRVKQPSLYRDHVSYYCWLWERKFEMPTHSYLPIITNVPFSFIRGLRWQDTCESSYIFRCFTPRYFLATSPRLSRSKAALIAWILAYNPLSFCVLLCEYWVEVRKIEKKWTGGIQEKFTNDDFRDKINNSRTLSVQVQLVVCLG